MKPSQMFKLDIILPEAIRDPTDDNTDVEVTLADGRRFAATFFTRKNIDSLLRYYATSGECSSGLYFCAKDLIIVERLSEDTIHRTIKDLIETGDFEDALMELIE